MPSRGWKLQELLCPCRPRSVVSWSAEKLKIPARTVGFVSKNNQADFGKTRMEMDGSSARGNKKRRGEVGGRLAEGDGGLHSWKEKAR